MKTCCLLIAAVLLLSVPATCSAEALTSVEKPILVQQVKNRAGVELYNAAYESYALAKKSSNKIQCCEHYFKA
ncbi:secreted protein, partial [gut metagenome]